MSSLGQTATIKHRAIYNNLQELRRKSFDLLGRARELNHRVRGPQPEPAPTPSPEVEEPPMADLLDTIHRNIDCISDQVLRLEEEL